MQNNWEKTISFIPDGVQTLSKMPSKYVEGVYPTYIERGEGSHVWGDDGKEYIDFPCGLGAVLLGYNEPEVKRAVVEQLEKGVLFSLPNYLETELAEKLCDLIPCFEMVRFLKTGSEATSAAVKIARAYTGKNVILCCGYHGWHNWYNWTTPKNKGVPRQQVFQFKYNDYDGLQKLLVNRENRIAAIIMEPYILEAPKDDFLKKIRKLCYEHNILLIFDEIITGFRTVGYSAQKMFDITPDLTCLGKAIANGLPISVVGGRREIMKELITNEGDCFVSSTFGGELLGIAAALKTIEIVERDDVIGHIWRMGEQLQEGFNSMARSETLGDSVKCIGYPPRTFFIFPTEAHKGLFWQECLKMGVFFGYAQFISYSHKQSELDKTLAAIRHGLKMVRKFWDKPEDGLEGMPPKETFRLVCKKE